MKRTFLKVLPFAAALLLATSCSKDDNNSTDEIVNGGEQIETVTKTVKTLTIKGKVRQSISKVTTNQDETALVFEEGEKFTFGQEGDDVYGTITILDANGNYEATVNYADEVALLSEDGFTATLGTNPETISGQYDNLAAAVKNAYYVIPFKVEKFSEDLYLLSRRSLSKDAERLDIVVNLQSAFIKALSAETTKLGGTDITVVADKYYVVPVGKAMGSSGQNTVAGKIYNLGFIYVDLGVTDASGKSVYWAQTNLYDKIKWSDLTPDEKNNMPKQADFKALWDNCYWQWGNDGTNKGYYVFKPYAASDKQKTNASGHTYSTTSGDSYIFLPAVIGGGYYGFFWSGESSDDLNAFCLDFNEYFVYPRDLFNVTDSYSVRLVRRSN